MIDKISSLLYNKEATYCEYYYVFANILKKVGK